MPSRPPLRVRERGFTTEAQRAQRKIGSRAARDSSTDERDPVTEKIIGLAIEVHRALGPGLLESAYEECLCHDLKQAGFGVRRQVAVPLVYREIRLDSGYRADVLVNDSVLLEIKSVERLMPIHEAQMLTYLKLAKVKIGLLMNFNVEVLRHGIRRFVHSQAQQSDSSATSAPLR